MKDFNFLAALAFAFSSAAFAGPPATPPGAKPANCGIWDQNWMNCETNADCTVVGDSCGVMRVTVNKKNAAVMTKFQSCISKTQMCPKEKQSSAPPKFKCEKYAFAFPGAKNTPPAVPRCITLGSIIDMAINMNDRAKVEATLQEAGEVDLLLNPIHETPLTLAAMNAKTEIVKMLLSKHANVNFQTLNGYSPLIFAAMGRSVDKKETINTVEVLLKAGANKALKTMDGKTALDIATRAGNQDLIKLLK